jgi:pimeloyl-ACP methyl ester carboxylesterase
MPAVQSGGVPIHYEVIGKGQPIVLVHGFSSSFEHNWQRTGWVVLRSRWQDVQPRAREQNAFLKAHSWEEYAAWHLGLTEGAVEETKALYAFVYGDFRRLHRMGLIACHYRAAEWRHKEIELAAHELLQYLDRQSA